jgi:hypothetical protein
MGGRDVKEDFVRKAMLQRGNEIDDVCAGFMTNGIDMSRIRLRHFSDDMRTTEILVDGVLRAAIKQVIEFNGGKLVCRTEVQRFNHKTER